MLQKAVQSCIAVLGSAFFTYQMGLLFELHIGVSLAVLGIVTVLLYALTRKASETAKKSNIILMLIATICIVIGCVDFGSLRQDRVSLILQPMESLHKESLGSEVWVTDITTSQGAFFLGNETGNEDWVYKAEYDDFVFYDNGDGIYKPLEIEIPYTREVRVGIINSPYSTGVNIIAGENSSFFDIYSEDTVGVEYAIALAQHQMDYVDVFNAVGVSSLILGVLLLLHLVLSHLSITEKPVLLALGHWGFSFLTDSMIFTISSVEYQTRYYWFKAIFLIVLIVIWYGIDCFVRQYKANNQAAKVGFRFFAVYEVFLSLLMLAIWPGNWIWDEIFICTAATKLTYEAWQHFLSSVFHIISMMMIPFPSGVVIVQYTLASVIVGHIMGQCSLLLNDQRRLPWLMLPFFFFPVLAHLFYPIRLSMYTFIELLFLISLSLKSRAKKHLSIRQCVWYAFLIVILSTWRTEGIFFLPIGLVLLFMLIDRKIRSKGTALALLIVVLGYMGISRYQSIAIGDKKDLYGVTAYCEIFDDLVRAEVEENPESEILSNIEGLVDLDIVVDSSSGEEAFWDGAYKNLATHEEYALVKRAFFALALKHPLTLIQERFRTFFLTSACLPETKPFVQMTVKEIRVPEFLKDYPLTRSPWPGIRTSVLSILCCINETYSLNWLGRLCYNIIPPVLILIIMLIVDIKNKQWIEAIIECTLLVHIGIVFIAAPGVYFMYYLPVYLCAYFRGMYAYVFKLDCIKYTTKTGGRSK